MKKRVLSLALALVLVLALGLPAFAASYPAVTYVPLRSVAEGVGYKVDWEDATRTAIVTWNGNTARIQPDKRSATVNFVEGTIDVPVVIEKDRTYIDASFFINYLDINLTSDPATATVKASANPLGGYRNLIRNNEYAVKEQQQYKVETYDLMLPMDDGVSLRTIVYKPEGEGPWPTAFTRGPYDAYEPLWRAFGEEYAKRGMAFVAQFCRGKGGSEGVYIANVDERADGIASLNWLNDQSWVESIGMHGHSYLALTTWIVGDALPSKVKALHVQCYGVLRNLSVSHSGLVACDNIIAWTLQNCTSLFSYDKYIEDAQYLPNVKVDDELWGGNVEGYDDWINHPDFTDDYWNEGVWGDLKKAVAGINVPTAIWGGYYDHHFEGTIEGWNLLSDATKTQSHLVLGCWNHSIGYTAAWKEASNWQKSQFTDTFNWLYSILVKGEVPVTGVDAYVVGDDEWVHLDSFPLENDGELTYYLTGDKAEVASGTAAKLSTEKPAAESTKTYVYDPSNPKWAEGGECFLTSDGSNNKNSEYVTTDLRGSHALSEPGYRSDVLSFVSEPLTEDTTLAGNLVANLWVSTDVEDTAFTYTISEVDENGQAYNIRNGLLTIAYRNDRYAAAVYDYKPGEIVEMKIESLPIVWTVPAGHSIRVDISSSDFPEFTNHTNTVGHWAEQTGYKVANQVIYIGGDHASSITLPTLSK